MPERMYYVRSEELPEDYFPWDASFTDAMRNLLTKGHAKKFSDGFLLKIKADNRRGSDRARR